MGDVLRILREETNVFGGAPRCTPIGDGNTAPDPMVLSIVIRARAGTTRFTASWGLTSSQPRHGTHANSAIARFAGRAYRLSLKACTQERRHASSPRPARLSAMCPSEAGFCQGVRGYLVGPPGFEPGTNGL